MARKVYVGSVLPDRSPQEVRLAIAAVSTQIETIEVTPRADGTGNIGMALVTYRTPEAAEATVAKGLTLFGQQAKLTLVDDTAAAKRKAEGEAVTRSAKRAKFAQAPTRILLVTGFPIGTDSQALKRFFETQGEVETVELHHPAGAKAPFALVHMSAPHEAERAKQELQSNLFRGGALNVDYAFEDKPQSNPVAQKRVHIALDPKAPGNREITLGMLLAMIFPVIDEGKDHGAFVDRHGHVIIPSSAFPAEEEEEDGEAVDEDSN